jgi:hypothetical protein
MPAIRVCVKLFSPEPPDLRDDLFLQIFHEWIRDRALDVVFVDVADYTHVPDGPGVMLVTSDVTFALDRSDGRFGLLAQQRRAVNGDVADAISGALRDAWTVAERLESDERLVGKVSFDRQAVRVEVNDRLNAPNTDASFAELAPAVRDGMQRVYPGRSVAVARATTDSRDRLAMDVRLA